LQPSGWSIALQGSRWILVFENPKLQAVVSLSDSQFEKFTRESMAKLRIKGE